VWCVLVRGLRVSWIGLKTTDQSYFDASGLATPARKRVASDMDGFLPHGTLLAQFTHHPVTARRNLLRYAVRSPWPSSLTICADPDGTFHLLQGQGDRSCAASLPTALVETDATIHISFSWDAPARLGVFSIWAPDTGKLYQTEFRGPLPLSINDADHMTAVTPVHLRLENCAFLAISSAVEPVGPAPDICAGAALTTPYGATLIEDLKPGQMILTHGGDVAQVRWIGFQDLPAAGRFTPLTLRSPYHGLREDITVSTEARLILSGSEIEYLFGEEAVAVNVGHLADRHSVARRRSGPVVRYYQVLLDTASVMNVNGAAIESFDVQPILSDPHNVRHSVLRDTPVELLPHEAGLILPVLRDFEALTLAR